MRSHPGKEGRAGGGARVSCKTPGAAATALVGLWFFIAPFVFRKREDG